jgi:hypothetical protein
MRPLSWLIRRICVSPAEGRSPGEWCGTCFELKRTSLPEAHSSMQAMFELAHENQETLHRRAVHIAALLMGSIVLPFFGLMAWITWSIIFAKGDWGGAVARGDVSAVPDLLAGLFVLAAAASLVFAMASRPKTVPKAARLRPTTIPPARLAAALRRTCPAERRTSGNTGRSVDPSIANATPRACEDLANAA